MDLMQLTVVNKQGKVESPLLIDDYILQNNVDHVNLVGKLLSAIVHQDETDFSCIYRK